MINFYYIENMSEFIMENKSKKYISKMIQIGCLLISIICIPFNLNSEVIDKYIEKDRIKTFEIKNDEVINITFSKNTIYSKNFSVTFYLDSDHVYERHMTYPDSSFMDGRFVIKNLKTKETFSVSFKELEKFNYWFSYYINDSLFVFDFLIRDDERRVYVYDLYKLKWKIYDLPNNPVFIGKSKSSIYYYYYGRSFKNNLAENKLYFKITKDTLIYLNNQISSILSRDSLTNSYKEKFMDNITFINDDYILFNDLHVPRYPHYLYYDFHKDSLMKIDKEISYLYPIKSEDNGLYVFSAYYSGGKVCKKIHRIYSLHQYDNEKISVLFDSCDFPQSERENLNIADMKLLLNIGTIIYEDKYIILAFSDMLINKYYYNYKHTYFYVFDIEKKEFIPIRNVEIVE